MRLRGLCDLPEFETIDAALGIECRRVLVHGRSAENESFGFRALPRQIEPLYRAGMTLYLVGIVSASPTLGEWVDALHSELRLPQKTVTPRLLASRKGGGMHMHFDPSEGFIVQVKGRKVWRLAPNRDIAYPPVGHVAGQPLPSELAELVPGGLPHELPGDTETVEMRPGSVLFLPRGWWHETETLEDSLHLDLTMELPTWEQRARNEISGVLRRHDRWRAPAVGSWPEMRAQLLKDLSRPRAKAKRRR